MRTLLWSLFFAGVMAVAAGCGGGGKSEVPKKFAPMPEKGAQTVATEQTPVSLPPTKKKSG
jgi:hypothetical protein